jgi:RNA dependent RNA polymerase
MEVHIKNVPEQTNEKALKHFLRPYLAQLRIRSVHIFNHYGKTWARVTFLNPADAQRFLTHHGQFRPNEGRRPVPISSLYVQLRFFGKPIYCEKSNKDANPVTIRVLKREENERQVARIGDQPKPPEILPVTFTTTSLSCGCWEYHDSELVFVPQVTWNVKGTAKFSKRSMMLVLDSGLRLDFRYTAIVNTIIEIEPTSTFIFSMHESPRLFEKIEDDALGALFALLGINGKQTPQLKPRKKGPQRHRLSGLNNEHEKIAGNCLVYRVELERYVSISRSAQDAIEDRIHDLRKAKEIPPMIDHAIDVRPPDITHAASFQALHDALSSLNRKFPFEVAFQVQRLAQNNYLQPSKVLGLFPSISSLVDRTGVLVTVAALRKLFRQIPFPAPDVEANNFDLDALSALLEANAQQLVKDGIPSELLLRSSTNNVAIIHKVSVTPTGIYLFGPEQESNNRILRKYSAHHDSFMRVRFCDEDGSQLYFGPKISGFRVFSRFKKILEDGIQIAGRTYSFLGFSHSSLRAQSCWFVAPFIHDEYGLQDYEDIIQGLGNFTLIRSPAKCAARIGQAFSDTRTAVSIDPAIVQTIDDVERNGRVFSDGVGIISLSLLERISDLLPRPRSMPACLQIRYRGIRSPYTIFLLAYYSSRSFGC